MTEPRKENYNLETPKGKAQYTVAMLNYRHYLRDKKKFQDVISFKAENAQRSFCRQKYGRRFTYMH